MLHKTISPHFENECCSIEHHPDAGCVMMTWKGLLPSQAFREIYMQALSLFRMHGYSKLLTDARRMKTIGSADAEWVISYWMPSAIAAGFRFNAIVESDYIFNQDSLNNIIEKTDPLQVTFKHFKDPEAALFWLKSC